MIKRKFLIALGSVALVSACTTTSGTGPSASDASKRQSIDAGVNTALSELYAQVPESRSLVAKARGVLVFPSVIAAGFVIGGAYGQGALLEGGRTNGYYRTATGSVGWLAGAESKAVYVLFMTPEALDRFKSSKGWTVGADASITVINAGVNASIDTQTVRHPVIGYVLAKGGLMANLSLDGTKVTRLDL